MPLTYRRSLLGSHNEVDKILKVKIFQKDSRGYTPNIFYFLMNGTCFSRVVLCISLRLEVIITFEYSKSAIELTDLFHITTAGYPTHNLPFHNGVKVISRPTSVISRSWLPSRLEGAEAHGNNRLSENNFCGKWLVRPRHYLNLSR